MQLSWPRAGAPPPLPSSRANYTRQAPVVRGSHDEHYPSDYLPENVMKATPPTPSSIRRLMRSNFKFGNSAGAPSSSSEGERLLSADSKEDLKENSNQFQNTLEKLQRFRFGSSDEGKRKKRSGDKTEKLRELTDILRGKPDRKKPPPSKSPNKHGNLRSFFGSTNSLSSPPKETKGGHKRVASVTTRSTSPISDEVLTPEKTEEKPFTSRSASFSQCDFRGKYRSKDSQTFPSDSANGRQPSPESKCLTYPPCKRTHSEETYPRELPDVKEESDAKNQEDLKNFQHEEVFRPLETLGREIDVMLSQTKPEIFITTWPKPKEEMKDPANRWSNGSDNTSEPKSPEESGNVPQWPKLKKLVCQSSEEKEEEKINLSRNDSLSDAESDPRGSASPMKDISGGDRTCSPSPLLSPSDVSDCESKPAKKLYPKRYSKRPLRGPYGEMLEAEMKKPDAAKKSLMDDLQFLENFTQERPSSDGDLRQRSLDDSHLSPRIGPKRKISANIPFSGHEPVQQTCHQRTTSSPSQLVSFSPEKTTTPSPSPSPAPQQLLDEEVHYLPDGSSNPDLRNHVVRELISTESFFVESLQIIVQKYLHQLKFGEYADLVEASIVDEIFFQIPEILAHHETLLLELNGRLDNWSVSQKVGDILLDFFTKQAVIETYTSFINNWKKAKEAIKTTSHQKPHFAKFLRSAGREHKGKLELDALIIMPVQRVPRYELLLQRLLKHTEPGHPDHELLRAAQHEIHELAVKINLTERENLEMEQQQQTLRELESLIDGLVGLTRGDRSQRTFLRIDTVLMATGQGTTKERALFLFSDLLVICSVKRRNGPMRKPSGSNSSFLTSSLDTNKYKLLMRIPLEDLEIVKTKDENVRRMLREVERLTEDVATLNHISELLANLHTPHSSIEEAVREVLNSVTKSLNDRQGSDSQLCCLDLTVNTQNGTENLSVIFSKPDKRANWEESFLEAKQKLELTSDRRPCPEFVASVPIRKTRAGLQFTCAAPTLGLNEFNLKDVWVCNSDGYVGQVCVLSLHPEPNVLSCNGVCNARILCVASVPASSPSEVASENSSESREDINPNGPLELESSSSSSEEEETEGENEESNRNSLEHGNADDCDHLQPTMWLGTEDGNIHVYNCADNIRVKKNKLKIHHGSSVQSILYFEGKVFAALANGDVCVYNRDRGGSWNTSDPTTISIGTAAAPVSKMAPVAGRLWCATHQNIRLLNTANLIVEKTFSTNSENNRPISSVTVSGLGVWIAMHNCAIINLYHAITCEHLCEVNIAPSVTKMLAGCDDIIRQHKAACLRVTSLLTCKDLLWIGSSAGVVLTLPLPHITQSTTKLTKIPHVTGVPQGHTGHVRFLTCVETSSAIQDAPSRAALRHSLKNKADLKKSNCGKFLVISGGDGYEDFRNGGQSDVAGREDSTNHLLLWHI